MVEHDLGQAGSEVTFYADVFTRTLFGNRLQTPFNNGSEIVGAQIELRWPGKIKEATHQGAYSIHFSVNISSQFLCQRICIVQFLSKYLGRTFNDTQRIADLMRQTGSKLPQRGPPFL